MISWPRCPECHLDGPERVDRANEVMPAEALVIRSYRCTCGWSAWTSEQVIATRPPTLSLRRKFSACAPPTVQTVSTQT